MYTSSLHNTQVSHPPQLYTFSMSEPVAEPVAEPAAEPVAEPVAEPAAELVQDCLFVLFCL